MNFTEYQQFAKTTAVYHESVKGLHPLLGLIGEVGEFVEKARKQIQITTSSDQANNKVLNDILQILDSVIIMGQNAESFKKYVRKNGLDEGIAIQVNNTEESSKELTKEGGDILWYLSDACETFNMTLDNIAVQNKEKLQSRQQRGVLHASGDNR